MSDPKQSKDKKGKSKAHKNRPPRPHPEQLLAARLHSSSQPSSPVVVPTGSNVASSSTPSQYIATSSTPTFAGIASDRQSPNVMSTDGSCSSTHFMLCDAGSRLPDNRLVIRPNGSDEFYPPAESTYELSRIIHAKYEKGWPEFNQVPADTKKLWFEEFKLRCAWDPSLEGIIHKIWRKRCSAIIRAALRDIRIKKTKGEWLSPVARKALEEYWETPEFKEKSARNKINRAVNPGNCLHRGGRVGLSEYKKRMENEFAREVHYPEVFKKVQHNDKKGWITQKAADTYNQFEQLRNSQKPGTSESDSMLWLKVVGGRNKKGRAYGLGTQAGLLNSYGSTAHSTGELTQLKEHFKKELDEQARQYETSFAIVVAKMEARSEEMRAQTEAREEALKAELAENRKFMSRLLAQMNIPLRQENSTTHFQAIDGDQNILAHEDHGEVKGDKENEEDVNESQESESDENERDDVD